MSAKQPKPARTIIKAGRAVGKSTAIWREMFPGCKLTKVKKSDQVVTINGVKFYRGYVGSDLADAQRTTIIDGVKYRWVPGHWVKAEEQEFVSDFHESFMKAHAKEKGTRGKAAMAALRRRKWRSPRAKSFAASELEGRAR